MGSFSEYRQENWFSYCRTWKVSEMSVRIFVCLFVTVVPSILCISQIAYTNYRKSRFGGTNCAH